MRKPRPRRNDREEYDKVVALLEALPKVRITLDGSYNFIDRARDFIAVFSTEEGKRVLSQIHQICDPPPQPKNADKPGLLAYNEGKRRVMAEIMLCMVAQQPSIERINEDVS